jgi:signal transduction histidine kinase
MLIFIGFLIALLVCNLFLYLIYKDKTYLLHLVLQCVIAALFFIIEDAVLSDGYILEPLNESDFSFTLLVLTQWLAFFLTIRFNRLLFDTKKNIPRVDRFCHVCEILFFIFPLITLAAYFFLNSRLPNQILAPVSGVLASVICPLTAFIEMRKGSSKASIYFITYCFVTTGIWLKVIDAVVFLELYKLYSALEFTKTLHNASPHLFKYGLYVGWFLQLIGILLIFFQRIDETKKQYMEQQHKFIQVDKLVTMGTLASGMIHDIYNPLTAIAENNEFQARHLPSLLAILDEAFKDKSNDMVHDVPYHDLKQLLQTSLEDNCKCIQKVNKIIDNIRDFIRKTAVDHFEETDLNLVIRDALALLDYQLKKFALELQVTLADNLPAVLVNFQLFEQVLFNVVINSCEAIKAIKSAGKKDNRICIGTSYRREDHTVVLTVTDTGTGMDAKVLKQIKQPFYTTRYQSGGTGLGLFVSNEIVKKHNGTMHIVSQPGKGTATHIAIPAIDHPADREEGSCLQQPVLQ